jgi:hypothetical protein
LKVADLAHFFSSITFEWTSSRRGEADRPAIFEIAPLGPRSARAVFELFLANDVIGRVTLIKIPALFVVVGERRASEDIFFYTRISIVCVSRAIFWADRAVPDTRLTELTEFTILCKSSLCTVLSTYTRRKYTTYTSYAVLHCANYFALQVKTGRITHLLVAWASERALVELRGFRCHAIDCDLDQRELRQAPLCFSASLSTRDGVLPTRTRNPCSSATLSDALVALLQLSVKVKILEIVYVFSSRTNEWAFVGHVLQDTSIIFHLNDVCLTEKATIRGVTLLRIVPRTCALLTEINALLAAITADESIKII